MNAVASKVAPKAINSTEIQELVDTMFQIAHGEQGDTTHKTMVGLAAPQIGVGVRVIIVGVDATGNGEQAKLKEFINPMIVSSSDETEEGREGCYSTDRVCGIVSRAKTIKVEAYDRNGSKISTVFSGFPARVFQHEVDHLDGVRFPDKITEDSKLHWVEPNKFGEYRKDWANWTLKCSRKNWEDIKHGRSQ